ncbi:divergent polysaccharide deacetylase family protein [Oricola cellulosilytica]|uniref:divergent polysaccharide deacetylase family protein n=1 Tax=Oricola cellulosilytica TaxID=1429082 RepID=UPI001CBE8637|nr:divergent polysaccharide deacetylase family protein [Oricola cellulosilytica]
MQKRKERHRVSGGWQGKALVACVFLGLAGLNVYSLATRDNLPETAAISIEAPAVADGETEMPDRTAAPSAGVEIVYGDGDTPASAEGATVPEDGAAPADGRLSEGGPKVIVIRDPSAASVGQPLQVAHLPDEEALEKSEWGDLPARTGDGRRPMDIYARPWSQAGGKRIAIVIGGMGVSQTGTQNALRELPPEVTLAFAPHGNSLGRWMRQARKKGHELLMQVPMEPFNYPQSDPGPETLTLAASAEENLAHLRWALGRMTNYTGVVNYLGGRFANDDGAITPVLREVADRGLLYLNDGTAGGERLRELAAAHDVPYVAGHVILDASRDPAAISAQLKQLEQTASTTGFAVGSGSAFETTVEIVASWANGAKKRGFELVGVSALAR